MGLLTWIKDRFRNSAIPVGGTITTATDDDTFPTHITNEGLGGPFISRTLEEMALIPIERLIPGSLCTVMEHIRPDGSIFKRVRYVLDPTAMDWQALLDLDVVRIGDIEDYDLSRYWKIDAEMGTFQGTLETEYAPAVDYGNPIGPERPYFQEPNITEERYQEGYPDNTAVEKIWVSIYDPLVHRYQRQRFGSQGKWGIPVLITAESYIDGDYIDNMFRWVAKGTTLSAPPTIVNGKSNDKPAGWLSTPAVPDGIDYYTYSQNNDLYQITATKTVFGVLKSPWSIKKISTDPQLVRYGNNPGSTNYINPDGSDTLDWRGYYTPGKDTHMAIRLTVNSAWRIEMIDNEEGEYVDWIFKLFPVGYEPVEADRPTISNPFGEQIPGNPNTGCFDSPPANIPIDKVLYRSMGRKFNNGILKPSGWSFWVRADGLDVTQVVIEPSDTAFKYHANIVTPETIVLKAIFTKGGKDIVPTQPFKWYKGDINPSNQIIKGSTAGISANHNISGAYNEFLTINPNAVDNKQTYHVEAWFGGEDYFDIVTILDVTDGVGVIAVIESNAGFTYKNGQGSKTFTARLYENGHEVTTGLSYNWMLNGENVTPAVNPKNVTITGDQIDNQEVLKLTITRNGVEYVRTENLTDLNDADLPEVQYSVDGINWSTSAANAIYMRWSLDGGLTWSDAIKIKGEEAPLNGGFERNAYFNSETKPVASGLTTNLLPNPIGGVNWTDKPTAPTTGQNTWQVKVFFQKKQYNNDGTLNKDIDLTTANWTIVGTWSEAIRINGIDGEGSSTPGPQGNPGWSPIFSVANDGERRVLRVSDWTNPIAGATGKPVTGMFVGQNGFVTTASQAIDIRGPQGVKGNDGIFDPAQHFWDGEELYVQGSNGIPNHESWSFKFRKAKTGIVYYYTSVYRGASGGRWVAIPLGSAFNNMIPPRINAASFARSSDRILVGSAYYYPVLSIPMSGILKGGEIRRDWVGSNVIARRDGTQDYFMIVYFDNGFASMGSGSYIL